MHTDLHDDDLAYIRLLQSHLTNIQLPKYGTTASYTKGVGLFVDSWNPVPSAQIPHSISRAVSGESQADIAYWARREAEENHKRDAELNLLTQVENDVPLNRNSEGTLYLVLSKGPCRSCKYVVSRTFQSYYTEIRVVIWYREAAHFSHDCMLYGYEQNANVLGGYAVVYESKVTRKIPKPRI